MTDWSKIILDLMREHRISQRALARLSEVNRATLRACLASTDVNRWHLLTVEKVLAVFGYELEIMLSANPCLHAPLTSAVVERSSHQASDANAGKPKTGSATPDTIKSDLPHVSEATQPSGTKSAKPSSSSTPDASIAASPQPSLITSSHTEATASCSGPGPTGKPSARPVTPLANKAKKSRPRPKYVPHSVVIFEGRVLTVEELAVSKGMHMHDLLAHLNRVGAA